jgi:hypothetical protein
MAAAGRDKKGGMSARTNSAARRGLTTVILAAIWTGWLHGAVQAAPEEEALLIVKGAQHFEVQRQSTTSKQISYTLDLAYPARAIGEPQWEQLKKMGWTRCRALDPGQEAANADWFSFEDISVTPGRTVHQHLTNWARGDQMIGIALRYYSNMQAGPRPDNTEQHVYVFFDDEHGREMAEWLQLDCSE